MCMHVGSKTRQSVRELDLVQSSHFGYSRCTVHTYLTRTSSSVFDAGLHE